MSGFRHPSCSRPNNIVQLDENVPTTGFTLSETVVYTKEELLISMSEFNHIDRVKKLLKEGVIPPPEALYLAARHGHLMVLTLLMEKAKRFNMYTCFHEAAQKNRINIVEFLLSIGFKGPFITKTYNESIRALLSGYLQGKEKIL